jgi:hypothetical protein
MVKCEKITLSDEFLVLLGPIISRLFTCSNEGKKGACSSPISMFVPGKSFQPCLIFAFEAIVCLSKILSTRAFVNYEYL